ncbi:hypothetical protein [Amycolatopsis sp. M39]|uniref:hypothetical protein n=1 Tax=Amycolatopsis TaxID=1813 RepID=UPI00350E916C
MITDEHRDVERAFAELESEPEVGNRKDVVDHLIAEFVRHSVAEQLMYPAGRASTSTTATRARGTPRPRRS